VVKGNRPVPPWPEDYHTSVAELETNDLLKSTLTDETRHAQVVKELKEKYEREKIHAREVAKRLLESGQSDDPVEG
jgi:hypothetical protein